MDQPCHPPLPDGPLEGSGTDEKAGKSPRVRRLLLEGPLEVPDVDEALGAMKAMLLWVEGRHWRGPNPAVIVECLEA